MRLISPDSYLKEAWNLMIVVLTIFIAIEIPLRLTLDYSIGNFFIEIIITVILFIDIILNFNTQTYSKGIIIKNRKRIAKNYPRKFFIFDLLAAMPFFLIYLIFPGIVFFRKSTCILLQ